MRVAGVAVRGLGWAALLASSACVATASPPPARGILVTGPPPAVIVEERPPQPPVHATWVTGYWHWSGLQYVWIPGHWEAPPVAGGVWRKPAYLQSNGTYYYEPGGWATPTARPAAPPSGEAFR
jgi:hypothetical protein